MRVLVANKFFAPSGGAETVFFQTIEMLLAAGHDVAPFAMQRSDNRSSDWSSYFIPERRYLDGGVWGRSRDALSSVYSFEARRCIRRLIRAFKPDVAHLHNVYHQMSLSIVDELRSAQIPIVMTVHDYKPVCPNYQLLTHDGICRRCLGGKYWNATVHKCLKNSRLVSVVATTEAYLERVFGQYDKVDLFVSPSEFLADILVHAGFGRERVTVVPNAMTAEAVVETERRTQGARFVYCGRLTPEKGLRVLLEALERTTHDVHLDIYGDGPLRREIEYKIASVGIPAVVHGFTAQDKIASALMSSNALIVPSVLYENCPMVVLEAGAVGTPTIASALGGLPELVADQKSGLLVRPGDAGALAAAMDSIAVDTELAAALGAAAHARVRARHDPTQFLNATVGAYEWALNSVA